MRTYVLAFTVIGISRTDSYLLQHGRLCGEHTSRPHILLTFQSNSLKSLSQFGYFQSYLRFTISKMILRFLPKLGYQYPFSTENTLIFSGCLYLPLYLMLPNSFFFQNGSQIYLFSFTASNPVQISTALS